ncbi:MULTISPECIES: Type 1 glutamine amidotransferase-like domain-containing protein [unclassified Crossiella]|uniref:Type 1 glutamine amidotransferase-like domain-containing protein n=1 Tax=Crossiella sp. SN42 TaxID=2944808 RepID=UPI00207D0563|nr:peptidase E [Crossiella sp. SN42]MCO1577640.1 peptidase E [Crossiella sp. SN42]
MPAEQPTILATSGGLRRGHRTDLEFAPLLTHAVELAGVSGRRPKLCHIGTALGDQRGFNANFAEAGELAGVEVVHLNLFPMPPTADLLDYVLSCDVVWVGGGSVANLLAVWRVHGLDSVLREAWRRGVVLTGVSAGSLCWHVGGPTDSFGPELRIVTDGLGFLPYGNGVHFDSEAARRPAVLGAVASGLIPDTYCTDDGTGLLYHGTELVEVLSERPHAGVYLVQREDEGKAVEHALDVRRL